MERESKKEHQVKNKKRQRGGRKPAIHTPLPLTERTINNNTLITRAPPFLTDRHHPAQPSRTDTAIRPARDLAAQTRGFHGGVGAAARRARQAGPLATSATTQEGTGAVGVGITEAATAADARAARAGGRGCFPARCAVVAVRELARLLVSVSTR